MNVSTDDNEIESEPPIRMRVGLPGISSRAWEHPADRGALVALRKLRGYDVVVRKLSGLFNERAIRMTYLGSAVRADDRQFARVQRLFAEAGSTLDVRELPELYVRADPTLTAVTIGVEQPMVVISSSLVDLMDDEELRFVLGHELGHAQSGHAVYQTMVLQLLRLGTMLTSIPFGALGIRAVTAALLEWSRKSELSADRAGVLAGQDRQAALRTHMKLAGGGHLDDIDPTAFLAQAAEYDAATDLRDSVLKLMLLEATSHPFAVVRAGELCRWIDSGAYAQIVAGQYPRREDDGSASMSAEARSAARSYADSFANSQDALSKLVRDAADQAGNVRDWVSSHMPGRPGS